MQCPVCNVELKIADRQGVEIDYCPRCRGVWLDRGELDKLIERASGLEAQSGAPLPARRENRNTFDLDDDDDYKRRDDNYYRGETRQYPPEKKRKSFLGDMFEFLD